MIIQWWLLVLLILLIALIHYHWKRRYLYAAAWKFDGPPAYPIFGNALYFYGKNEEILNKIKNLIVKYENPFRFWLGPQLIICFSDPNHIEKIMSSSKFTLKHEIYDLLKGILGEGLVTASGPVYRGHRKIIQPLFNMKFSTESIDIFQKHAGKLIEKLHEFTEDSEVFDIHHTIHKCFVDIVGETVLGYNINAQENKNSDYIQAFIDMYDVGFTKLVKPWLHPTALYNFTTCKKIEDKIHELITSFMSQVFTESWTRRKLFKQSAVSHYPIIDQVIDYVEKNPGSINNKDLMYHMITLYAASEDTMTIISSFLCVCLGMYPEYQRKVAEEIRNVFGEKPRAVRIEDFNKLPYLDMCIKEVLRIMPIAPYILRRTVEDAQIDKYHVPKGCAILIPIYNLHHNQKYWQHPDQFYPDHFLPENADTRHTYAYIPFSAGGRSCIGKIFANIGLKTIIVNLLQNYELEADGKLADVKLKMDISVRPIDGYNVRLKRRVWK